ncbi:MAG: helix-hairpin-helix domain-containing protein [bacterium]|nr:MAG: helix-hairpin-helix domain-containing protein [bacterium]
MCIKRCAGLILAFYLSFIFQTGQVWSQENPELLNSFIDIDEEGSREVESWMENLWELMQHPIDLNNAKVKDLTQIPFLDHNLAEQIINFRSRHHQFSSLKDLLMVPGMSEEIFEAITPFLHVRQSEHPPRLIYRFQSRLEKPNRKGYISGEYHHPLYIQHRILFIVNPQLKGGFTWEKDAGEEKMFDYGSMYLQYQHPTQMFSLLVGDYYRKVGMGLVLWSPYGQPISLQSPLSRFTIAGDSRGNQSTHESGFLRGLSLEYPFGTRVDFDCFFSRRNLDGSLSPDRQFILSLDQSGLHRTENEKRKIDQVSSTVWGISIHSRSAVLSTQTALVIFHFQPSFRDILPPMRYFTQTVQVQAGRLKSIGEFALFTEKFPAIQHHITYSEGKAQFQISGFYYHPKYFAPSSRAFGSFQAPVSNGIGSAGILLFHLNRVVKLGSSFYIRRKIYDSHGDPFVLRDYAFDISFKNDLHWIYIQWKLKFREGEFNQIPNERGIHALRTDYRFPKDKSFSLHSRLELHWDKDYLSFARNTGISFFQQINWTFLSWHFTFRWTSFEVPEYDLRIYEYENDLPGNFRSVLLNGRGYKYFLLIRWAKFTRFQIDFKYSQRLYPDQQSISSGLNEIPSNRAQDFRLSFIMKY